jgi:hypothetical protein
MPPEVFEEINDLRLSANRLFIDRLVFHELHELPISGANDSGDDKAVVQAPSQPIKFGARLLGPGQDAVVMDSTKEAVGVLGIHARNIGFQPSTNIAIERHR